MSRTAGERQLYREVFKAGTLLCRSPEDRAALLAIVGESESIEQRGRGIVARGARELEYIDVRIYVPRKAKA